MADPLAKLPNSCSEAEERWDPAWIRCPVCQCMPDADGLWVHKELKDVLQ